MAWRRKVLVATALAVPLLLFPAASPQSDEGSYPVWWSPSLELKSLDEIDERLARRFPKAQRTRLYKYVLKDIHMHGKVIDRVLVAVDEKPVDNCNSLIKWMELDYLPDQSSDKPIKLHDALSSLCYILRALNRAKPVQTSYLRDFVFGSDALDNLPALLGGWGCRDVIRHLRANRDGIPWSKFDFRGQQPPPLFKKIVRSENQFVLEVWSRSGSEKYHETIFSIVGRGDFNGDGQDDLLLLTEFHQTFGDFKSPELFLLTRAKEGDVLRVIEVVSPLASDRNWCVPTPERLKNP